jgi:hypothetical protein
MGTPAVATRKWAMHCMHWECIVCKGQLVFGFLTMHCLNGYL